MLKGFDSAVANAPDEEGLTPFFLAATSGNFQAVRLVNTLSQLKGDTHLTKGEEIQMLEVRANHIHAVTFEGKSECFFSRLKT